MLQEVKDTIKKHDLLKRGDRVLIALSGGPDSVALIHILAELRTTYHLKLHAIHINHGIRPDVGEHEEQLCRELCGRLNVPLEIEGTSIPELARISGKGIEETARDFRYEAFERVADELNCTRIAVGHHADDQSETVLFRILRGTGRTGLRGIPIKRGRIIRPLLETSKNDILAYLKAAKLGYCTDESNADQAYARNYIRHRLLSEIRENVNPAVDLALRNLAESAGEEETFLQEIADKALRMVTSLTPGGKLCLDLARLSAYAVWIRRRTLRRCLMGISGDRMAPDRIVIARLERLCEVGKSSVSLPDKIRAVAENGRLYLFRREVARFCEQLDPGKYHAIPGLLAELRCSEHRYNGTRVARKPASRIVEIDADRIDGRLAMRSISPGDRFRPLGMRGSKKVGDCFTDRKVPAVLRDEIPVVCDNRSIVWVVGFEISETVKIDSRTRKVIRLAYRERKTARGNALRALIGSAEDRSANL